MNGVLVVDKPQGVTSHDVVAVARRALGERRIGHTGTLDPLATGVLPLACGRATRLVRFLAGADKTYEAVILFGLTTDTYDVTGRETSRSGGVPPQDRLDEGLASLRGAYLQTPPAYSAKKIGGRRAYDFARHQEPLTLTPVPVDVTALNLLKMEGPRATVRMTCSAGFYVRAFANDLGERVGTGACLEALRRTRSGEFGLDGALSLDVLAQSPPAGLSAATVALPMLLRSLPGITLTPLGRQHVSHGRPIGPADAAPPWPDGASTWTRLLDAEGALVALAEPTADGRALHPSVVLI
jgi:tRNA pseudouridine55 synthase